MQKIIKKNTIIIIMIMLISCDPVDDRLQIVNKSQNTIFYLYSKSDRMFPPLTHIKKYHIENGDSIEYDIHNKVAPNSTKFIRILGKKVWENYINTLCEDSTLRIFLFSKDTLEKYDWNYIEYNKMYLKKYYITVKYLEKQNWQIVYED